jgi:hypothetical protein
MVSIVNVGEITLLWALLLLYSLREKGWATYSGLRQDLRANQARGREFAHEPASPHVNVEGIEGRDCS